MTGDRQNAESNKPRHPQDERPWYSRWFPIALLALLVFGVFKFFGESKKHQAVVEQRDTLQQQLADSTDKLEVSTGETAALQANLETVQSDLDAVQSDHKLMQSEFIQKKAELDAANKELTALYEIPDGAAQLRNSLLTLKNDRTQRARELDVVNNQNALLNRQREGWQQTRDLHWQRILELKSQRTEALKTIDQSEEENSSLKTELTQLRGDLRTANNKIALFIRQREGWQQTRDLHWNRITELKSEKNTAMEMVGQSQETVNSQGVQLKQYKGELESANKKIALLDRQREGWQQTRDLHWNRISELKSQNNAALEIVGKNQDEISSKDAQLKQVKGELESASEKLALLNRQREGWQQTRDLHWSRITELKSQRNAAMEVVVKNHEDISSHSVQVKRFQSELEAATNKNALFDRQRAGWHQTRDLHWQRIVDLKSQNTSALKAIGKKEEEIKSLNLQTELLKARFADLSNRFEQSQTEIANYKTQVAKLQEVPKAPQLKDDAAIKDGPSKGSKDVANTLSDLQATLTKQLKDAGASDLGVALVDGNSAIAISLESARLFSAGSVALSRDGSVVLRKLAKVLEQYPNWSFDIQGHTDSRSIEEKYSAGFTSNQQLTSAKASAVATYFSLASTINPDSMSAEGFAATVPVADSDTNAVNRRVDIVLRSPDAL